MSWFSLGPTISVVSYPTCWGTSKNEVCSTPHRDLALSHARLACSCSLWCQGCQLCQSFQTSRKHIGMPSPTWVCTPLARVRLCGLLALEPHRTEHSEYG